MNYLVKCSKCGDVMEIDKYAYFDITGVCDLCTEVEDACAANNIINLSFSDDYPDFSQEVKNDRK